MSPARRKRDVRFNTILNLAKSTPAKAVGAISLVATPRLTAFAVGARGVVSDPRDLYEARGWSRGR